MEKYNANKWCYRSIEGITIKFVTVDKAHGYKVNPDNVYTIETTLAKLRVLDREHLNAVQLDGEYKRILQGKLQSIMPDGVTVVDILDYKETNEKYAFTNEELRKFGHRMTEDKDGLYWIDC